MWRAFFLACGIFACILGAECLAVDTFVWAGDSQPAPGSPATVFGSPPAIATPRQDLQPPDWAAWSLLSSGAIVILYSLTLNRQG
jgi:hypothetical protein